MVMIKIIIHDDKALVKYINQIDMFYSGMIHRYGLKVY